MIQTLLILGLIQIIKIQFIGSNVALRPAIPLPAVRPVRGWPPAGRRVVGLGKALKASKCNPLLTHFESLWEGGAVLDHNPW
jgi:hypothetical protein